MSCLVAAAALGPNLRITLLADCNMCIEACTAHLEAAARHIAAMRALAALALPPFDADLLAAVRSTLARLAL
jgi:hypothetical protein